MKAYLGKRTDRRYVYGAILALCFVIGTFLTIATFRQSLGMGDNSTFFAFARNTLHGEAAFKDFIHFRTPGNVWLYGFIMWIFGEQQSSLEIAVRIETLILYPMMFIVSGILLTKHKKNPLYILGAYLLLALLPGVAQLRAGFGLLAIAVYVLSYEKPKSATKYLVATGILTGLTFVFGQEIAVMVAVCLAASELIGAKWNREFWLRVRALATGLAVVLVPLALYLSVFSNIGSFIYYVTYYSFIRQPQFMNLPFPGFTDANLIYYAPFFIYWLCALVLYANRKFGKREALLLSFGILRLITSLSRADFGHLLFSIPEMFLIVPYFMLSIPDTQLTKRTLKSFAPFSVVLAALMLLSINGKAIALVLVPFVLLFAIYKRKSDSVKTSPLIPKFHLYLAIGFLFVTMIYRFWPTYINTLRTAKREMFNADKTAPMVGGVRTDPINYMQISEVKEAVEPLQPNSIFAFPIQSFYYRLAPHHASRFMTFEPQTTLAEQDKTIQDLQRNKPEVIIFDPLQAHGLSGSLWKISDYILDNYEIKKQVVHREILWVMVPKAKPNDIDKLVFQLYHDNTNKMDANGVENPAMRLANAIMQNTNTTQYYVDTTSNASFKIALADIETLSKCGIVKVRYDGATQDDSTTSLCAVNQDIYIPLKSNARVQITLEKQGASPVVWVDPTVIGD